MNWFDTARFGMFIHWGHISQQGFELSWPMVGGVFSLPNAGPIKVADYQASADTFNPQPGAARDWARRAKAAGMQYAVFTTKHHDGFAMFDTALSDFSVARHAPYGVDLVREYVEAFRAEGLRIGLYFSLLDWHHPDYPAFRDEDAPYRFPRGGPRPTPEQWERFRTFLFGQVRELLTNYGTIDVLWFDGHWERSADDWRAQELVDMIRALQPGILINDRLQGQGDFETPEQFVPALPPAKTWETCMTLNESWGYVPVDNRYKSSRQVIHTLCEVASKGGNLLLNVSPRGDGSLPPEQVERLDAVTNWMSRNSAAIVGTVAGFDEWQFYGPTTRRGDTVYLHALMRPYDSVTVRGVPIRKVRTVRALATGATLAFTTRCSLMDQFTNPNPPGELTIIVPPEAIDEYATIIAVDFAPA